MSAVKYASTFYNYSYQLIVYWQLISPPLHEHSIDRYIVL